MWISRAPELEEDVALANIALDLLGHARSLLRYAGSASGRSEDDLAYWRDEHEFRSAHLFEQPPLAEVFEAGMHLRQQLHAPDEGLRGLGRSRRQRRRGRTRRRRRTQIVLDLQLGGSHRRITLQ